MTIEKLQIPYTPALQEDMLRRAKKLQEIKIKLEKAYKMPTQEEMRKIEFIPLDPHQN